MNKDIVQFFNELPKMIKRSRKGYAPPVDHMRKPVPLFDLGQSLFAASKPGTLDFRGKPFWEAPAPFPSCWYHICYPHPNPARAAQLGQQAAMIHHMIHAQTLPDGRVKLMHYGKGASLADKHLDHEIWSYFYVACMFIKPGENWWFAETGKLLDVHRDGNFDRKHIDLDIDDLLPIGSGSDLARSMLAAIIKVVYFVAYANWVLAQPKSLQIEETAVPVDNKLRRLRNQAALPPAYRILHVNFRSLRRLPSGNHTGVEKAPHDRRAHLRQLADGRTVTVRASKIKGGALVPRMYELRHDFPET